MNASGTTTTDTRHLKNCLQTKLADEGVQKDATTSSFLHNKNTIGWYDLNNKL